MGPGLLAGLRLLSITHAKFLTPTVITYSANFQSIHTLTYSWILWILTTSTHQFSVTRTGGKSRTWILTPVSPSVLGRGAVS